MAQLFFLQRVARYEMLQRRKYRTRGDVTKAIAAAKREMSRTVRALGDRDPLERYGLVRSGNTMNG